MTEGECQLSTYIAVDVGVPQSLMSLLPLDV